MKFSYEKQIDIHNPQLPWRSRPAVRVQLSYGDRYQSVMALIDSGAEITLFHISLAKQLGITLFQREATVFGISGELMPVYFQCNGSRSLPLIEPDSPPGILTVFPSCLIIRNGPRRQGFASPRNNGAPLTAPGRSEHLPHKRERP
jgi:hypothetical protein